MRKNTNSHKLLREVIKNLLIVEAAAIEEVEAREIIERFPKGLRKYGVDASKVKSFKKLGTGTRGTAFDVGGGKVLKVTNDLKETQAAAKLMGKDLPNIVKYFGVWKFGDSGTFGITQEFLYPISKEDGKELNAALVKTGLPVWLKKSGYDWDASKELVKKYVLDQVKSRFKGGETSEEAKAFAKEALVAWDLLVSKYKIRDMFKTLQGLGIDFHDFHAGNVMRRQDGSIVLIDLGYSKISGDDGAVDTINERLTRTFI
jgi:hypothetical protein